MRTVIADDEPIARQVLRELLETFSDIEVVGEAATGMEAVDRIERLNPDLILLDLEMPELDGFSVVRSFRRVAMPLVVFVTAFHKHALEAFDTGAVDYVLKPVRRERLEAALDKARAQLRGRTLPPAAAAGAPQKIVGKMGSETYLLDPADVIAFQADGEIVYILTAKGRLFANHSLRELEQRLEGSRFRRVHRKTIINTSHIRRVSPLSSKRWLLKMSNGMEVVVSKRLAGTVRAETRW